MYSRPRSESSTCDTRGPCSTDTSRFASAAIGRYLSGGTCGGACGGTRGGKRDGTCGGACGGT
eukprot:5700060-Prymnesium_polylepis.1